MAHEISNRMAVRLLLLALPAMLAGCDGALGPARPARQSLSDFGLLRLPGADLGTVRPIAMNVFKQYYRLDSAASTGVVLRSQPAETDVRGDADSANVREVLSGRQNRRRELAELHVIEDGPDVILRCQVQVQRLDTVERRAFAGSMGGDDRPSETPRPGRTAGRDEVTPEEWVNVGRNRQLEREILDMIAEVAAAP